MRLETSVIGSTKPSRRGKSVFDLNTLDCGAPASGGIVVIRLSDVETPYLHVIHGGYLASQPPTAAAGALAGSDGLEHKEDDWHTHLFKEVDRLSKLVDDWNADGAEAPNSTAIYWTKEVLRELLRANVRPNRVIPSAEGGIAITFRTGRKYADIECFNTGEILAITSDGESKPEAWVVDSNNIQLSLEIIHEFFSERAARANVLAGAAY